MQIEEGSRGYMHYCKIEMYADRAGGICTRQGWYSRGKDIYALCRVGGWYKILGRSESQAVKKPSNRGVATLVREHTAHPPTALALRQTS